MAFIFNPRVNAKPVGFQRITSLSSATSLTPPSPDCNACIIQPESQSVRWRDDGTDPTTTTGGLIKAEQALEYTGQLDRIRLIETAASASANVTYYLIA